MSLSRFDTDFSLAPASDEATPPIFYVFLAIFVGFILYNMCWRRPDPRGPHAQAAYPDDDDGPPPPYQPAPSKPYSSSSSSPQQQAPGMPGSSFWMGLAAGTGATLAGNALLNRNRGESEAPRAVRNGRLDRDWGRGEGSSGSSGTRTSTGCVPANVASRCFRLRCPLQVWWHVE